MFTEKSNKNLIKTIVDDSQESEFAIISHGYADYMRDYEIVVANYEGINYISDKIFQFVGCVSALVKTQIDAEVYARSFSWPAVDDNYDGFEWGVRFSTAHYGIDLIEDEESAHWSNVLGVDMFKACIVSEAFSIILIFHDLKAKIVEKGACTHRSSPL